MKRFFLNTLLLGTFLFSVATMANTVILRSMQMHAAMHESRITFNLSAPTQYRAFMLYNPNRFVVDLKNVKTFHPLHLDMAGTAIRNFKYATHRDGIFRIVFGLNSSLIPQTRVLPENYLHEARLQISFYNQNMAAQPKPATPVFLSDTPSEESHTKHRDIIIVVDPGHGGKDPGATGPGGTHEKTIVLAISKKLQRDINQLPGFHADLTRTGDYYLTLRQRLAIARKDHADMFIAIHADIWRNKSAGGVSVFALSQRGATSEAARWLAARENASELMGGVNLQDKSHLLKSVLINLSQSATIRTSLEIGEDVIQAVKPIARLHHDVVEQAAFVVLKSPDIPSLLVETGFLSNPHEEERLRSQSYQKKLAMAIMQGIDHYFAQYPPPGTWVSYWRNHPHVTHSEPNRYAL